MAIVRRSRDPLATRTLFDRMFDEPLLRTGWWFDDDRARMFEAIPLDVYEGDDHLEVKASMPGIEADDIHVEVVGDELRIRGDIAEETEHDDDRYHLREHRTGRIERRIRLPQTVDTDAATATFHDGMLTLTLPKAPESRTHEISVERGAAKV